MRSAALAALFAAGAAGHGYALDPPPRAATYMKGSIEGSAGSCAVGICLWFSQGCTIGCPKCGGSNGQAECGAQQGKPTLPSWARTFTGLEDCGTGPWCAPGSSPIMNPCGVAGGDISPGQPGNGGEPPPGHKQGEDGRLLPELPKKTTWKTGHVVNISWSLIANHGGGYQFRLCKKSAKPTEKCFQENPMPFVGKSQYIQYCNAGNASLFPPYNPQPPAHSACDKPDKWQAIAATDVAEGTIPAGSAWRRNPIPPCKSGTGGAFGLACGATGGGSYEDYQFPPGGPDRARPGQLLGGFGAAGCYGAPIGRGCGTDGQNHNAPYPGTANGVLMHTFQFNIVDRVRVPQVPPGEYIMSYRWDCEQTPQIWSTCSDVTIIEGKPAPPPKPPAVTTYGCVNNQCVPDPAGIDKATCEVVCHP